jgi:hypothetical protein
MQSPEITALRKKWTSEIDALLAQRSDIDSKIMGFQTMIKGLDYMEKGGTPNWKMEPIPLPPGMDKLHSVGLTEAIRLVLSHSDSPLMARQVRDRLVMHDYKQLPDSNPMAAVHGVLRRLVAAEEVEPIRIDSKRTGYRMLNAVEQAVRGATRSARSVFSGGRDK